MSSEGIARRRASATTSREHPHQHLIVAEQAGGIGLDAGYAEMLRSHAKIPPDFLESIEYDKAFSLNEEALFSTHKMDEKQRAFVYEYSAKILDFCKEHWSFGQKLINRWIKCLYIK